ncbi:hypothetical protein PVL29_001247 [Vitis rotundifolia]|uniref:Vinorine synthase n=1 Tax=Vitis rotundifolia TaxID=103349 RepID=A0AA39E4Y8_VITRO|nr:hypothetical protein PVL29_001247 [Vitis rotundifolia]
MGEMKVEVISRDTAKPSSPTPTDLRHLQLSFLDQITPPVFMPIILFYQMNTEVEEGGVERCRRLKESLSEILVRFHPLAGRVRDDALVECNDDGPEPAELNKFLPRELDDVRDLILAIQINVFKCGGIGIGVCISHKVADALSLVMFITSWAAAARGVSDTACPQFGMANLFPPANLSGPNHTPELERRRFTTVDFPRRPTRIEALSAFIWSRFVAATHGKAGPERIYTVLHSVNLRTRMDPPLPENYFGNVSRLAIATPCMDSEEECHGFVNHMRDAKSKINGDYVRKVQEGYGYLNFMKKRAESVSKGEVVPFTFTSLCRFPLYEADFGWGKPVWMGSASLLFKNLVVFMDNGIGGGIEAWINLKEADMAKFQEDKEFLSFVSGISDAKL